MSKRRISQQQSARIAKNQNQYRVLEHHSDVPTSEGLVIQRFGHHALIESQEGALIHCSIRANIDALVAGDRVIWQAAGSHQGVVVSCFPRQSVLGRPDKQGIIKPVAANISQIMVVIAPKPELSWPLLDSYLIMADYLHLQVCIVLNKTDLPSKTLQTQLIQCYEPLGYTLLFTNPTNKRSFKQLQQTLSHQTSVFVGQSGVGKSSLISRLLPHRQDIQTSPLSERTALGMHTTSSSCLYHLPTAGAIIDSPGVREFALWHMPIDDILKGYREFAPYLNQCKFRNCNHLDTLGCALLSAVNQHLISKQRYENFVRIAAQFSK